jgi:hypothetical protein
MFPKKGKFFPTRECRPGAEIRIHEEIAEALNEELRASGRTVKTIMEWTGASERTVKNWLAGRSSPRVAHLVCLMRHSSKVLDAMLRLAGKDSLAAGMQVIEARDLWADAVRRFDLLMCRR